MKKPTIIVAGITRCGSSLTMQMLHAAGLRCAGRYPAFEDPRCNNQTQKIDPGYVESFEAVKILDAHHGEVPKLNAKVIWLERDEVQQTRSIVKFMQYTMGMKLPPTAGDTILNSILHDAPLARAKFKGLPMLCLRFEDLIEHPTQSALRIAEFVWPEFQGDPTNIVMPLHSALLSRSSYGANCMPDMGIELQLIERNKEIKSGPRAGK